MPGASCWKNVRETTIIKTLRTCRTCKEVEKEERCERMVFHFNVVHLEQRSSDGGAIAGIDYAKVKKKVKI